MGKHTAKTGEAANRSRAALKELAKEDRGSRAWRRARNRRDSRIRHFNDTMLKTIRGENGGYTRPGSLKARTN